MEVSPPRRRVLRPPRLRPESALERFPSFLLRALRVLDFGACFGAFLVPGLPVRLLGSSLSPTTTSSFSHQLSLIGLRGPRLRGRRRPLELPPLLFDLPCWPLELFDPLVPVEWLDWLLELLLLLLRLRPPRRRRRCPCFWGASFGSDMGSWGRCCNEPVRRGGMGDSHTSVSGLMPSGAIKNGSGFLLPSGGHAGHGSHQCFDQTGLRRRS